MRMTRQRKAILDVLKRSDVPMSADMILHETDEPSLNLSTVYRTLDIFADEGLVARSTLEHTGYYHLNGKEHSHFMICLKCHRMFPIECHLDAFEENIQNHHGFLVTHHDMTVYGYCANCRDKIATP